MTEINTDDRGGDIGPRRSLAELAPLFNDISKNAPYLYAEVQVTVKVFINHPDVDDDSIAPGCIVQIEAPAPSLMPVEDDPILVGSMEKNITSLVIDGKETASPDISLQDVIDAFNLDVTAPIWQLGYE